MKGVTQTVTTRVYLCAKILFFILSFMKKFLYLTLAAIMTASCSNSGNDNRLKQSDYTVNYGESIKIDGEGSVKIENTFIASFSNGEIKGNHVGQTTGVYDGEQQISINVLPKYTYIDYPVCEWGISASELKSKHKAGVLADEDGKSVTYAINSGTKRKHSYTYVFSNNKLVYCFLIVPFTDAKVIVDWLGQKFNLGLTGDDTVFSGGFDANTTEEATTILGIASSTLNTKLYSYSLGYTLIFMDPLYNTSTTKAYEIDSFNIERLIKEFNIENVGIDI